MSDDTQKNNESEYSDSIADMLCEEIACGMSVSDLCKLDWTPSKRTFYKWRLQNAYFADAYITACKNRAFFQNELAFETIIEKPETMTTTTSFGDGESTKVQIDPAGVTHQRNKADILMRMAGMMQPRKFGKLAEKIDPKADSVPPIQYVQGKPPEGFGNESD